jgi:hypothetical protein
MLVACSVHDDIVYAFRSSNEKAAASVFDAPLYLPEQSTKKHSSVNQRNLALQLNIQMFNSIACASLHDSEYELVARFRARAAGIFRPAR